MTVAAPPRPPSQAPQARDSKPLEREEIEALVEALIEEARRERVVAIAGTGRSQRSRPSSAWLSSPSSTVARHRRPRRRALAARSSLAAAAATPRIAFISEPLRFGRQTDGGLYVVNADGSGKQRLTSARVLHSCLVARRARIAFGAGGNVWVMNADGSEPRKLTPEPGRTAILPGRPTAEDRLRALAPPPRGPNWWEREVYLMNADGSGQRRLARHATTSCSPLLPGRPTGGSSRSSATATDSFRSTAPGDLRRERRRQRAAEPDPQPRLRQRPRLVAGRTEDRLRPQLRDLRDERRRQRATEPNPQPGARPRPCLVTRRASRSSSSAGSHDDSTALAPGAAEPRSSRCTS